MTLQEYIDKHNYTLIEEYSTLGENKAHWRARVRHNETGEIHYLYYDTSYKYRVKCRSCGHHRQVHYYACYDCYHDCACCRMFTFDNRVHRGWRNITLENRRRHDKNVTTKITD